jgi:broad specificity phosphatase PhoE
MTAQAVLEAQPYPQPSLTISALLREQHFGIAEGRPWASTVEPGLSFSDHIAKGAYPAAYDRTDKFPGGESLNDLALRAETAVKELFLSYIHRAAKEDRKDIHVAVVSHGLCIGEIIRAMIRMDPSAEGMGRPLGGLANTAWARISITIKVRCS